MSRIPFASTFVSLPKSFITILPADLAVFMANSRKIDVDFGMLFVVNGLFDST